MHPLLQLRVRGRPPYEHKAPKTHRHEATYSWTAVRKLRWESTFTRTFRRRKACNHQATRSNWIDYAVAYQTRVPAPMHNKLGDASGGKTSALGWGGARLARDASRSDS
ncbi:hypothetical protein J6590_023107 [Homalodisca vitripennis]|nr:hypothetical protein J6590_023107 [Homalodisca vitripennis]